METVYFLVLLGVICTTVVINGNKAPEVPSVEKRPQSEEQKAKTSSDKSKEKQISSIELKALPVSADKPCAASDTLKDSELHHLEARKPGSSSRRRRSDASDDLVLSESEIQGFNAMRGRRDPAYSAIRGRRDPGFSAMRGRRDPGFSAMRGRRDQGFNAMRGRRDQGFNAMRGRRDQGFNAMRGRRDQGFSAMRVRRIPDYSDIEDSAIQSGYSPMRGKRTPLSSDRYIIIRGRRGEASTIGDQTSHSEPLAVSVKRGRLSPSVGSFNAMRGKKNDMNMA